MAALPEPPPRLVRNH